jgi:hypothetical protein
MNPLRQAMETYYKREGLNDPISAHLPNRVIRAADGSHEARWIAASIREGGKKSPATENRDEVSHRVCPDREG